MQYSNKSMTEDSVYET